MKNRWIAVVHHVCIFAVLYSLATLAYAIYGAKPGSSYIEVWFRVLDYYAMNGYVVAGLVAIFTLMAYSPHTGATLSTNSDDDSGKFGPEYSQDGLPMMGNVDSNGAPYGMD